MEEDTQIRKNISGFLGSIESDFYSHQKTIKILSWPEIYFELGKLKNQTTILKDADDIR